MLVLHRPVPPLSAVRAADVGRALAVVRQPRPAQLDGLSVEYVRYLSPPRPLELLDSWGAWAAPVARAGRCDALRREFPFDLVHAHYAVPAGDAVRRAAGSAPLVVSVHGHDVQGAGAGGPAVATTLRHARLVLANSAGTARRCAALGARDSRVVHLGADVPPTRAAPSERPTLVTVGHLAARKRHADVISALALLRDRHPQLRYVIVGDGPERERLAEHAHRWASPTGWSFAASCPTREATAVARTAALFVMPSVDEAFGVAYIEAMAGGVPAIGCRGEDGPEEIAAAGGGIELVPARDVRALADRIDALLSDRPALVALGDVARDTVEREFTWERCGAQTVAAYEHVLGGA